MSMSPRSVLAIDIGYGDVKVMANNHRFSFLAGYAPFRGGDAGYGNSVGLRYAIPELGQTDGPFIVGDKSRLFQNYLEPSGDGRVGSVDALPLLAKAIFDARLEGEIVLSTGAPIELYKHEKGHASTWEGVHLDIHDTKGEARSVFISKVVLRPQGVAAAISLVGRKLMVRDPGLGIVVDIGSRTTDIATLSLEESGPPDMIEGLCFSIPKGVVDMVNKVAEQIGARLGGFPPPRHLVQKVMHRPTYTFSGVNVDLAKMVEAARHDVGRAIVNEIRRRLGDALGQVVAIAGAGGGARPELLGSVVDGVVPTLRPTHLAGDGSTYLNVEGYYIMGQSVIASVGR